MSASRIPTITDKINLATGLMEANPAMDAIMRWNASPASQQIADFQRRTSYRDVFANLERFTWPADRLAKQIADLAALPSPLMKTLAWLERAQALQASHHDRFVAMSRHVDALTFPWKKFEVEHSKAMRLTDVSTRYDKIVAQFARSALSYPTLSDLLPDIDLGKLEAAVTATSRHLEESSKAIEDVPATLSDVRLVFADAEVAKLKKALRETIDDAVERVVRELRPTNRHQRRVVLLVVWNLVLLVTSIIGQPLFERMLHAMEAGDKATPATTATSALDQLFVTVADEAFVRIGPHTQQRYVATVHHGDIVRVIRKRGLWTLIMTLGHGKDRMSVTGWVKTTQISPLRTEVANVLDDTSTAD